jgi:hypothetical protein
MADGMGLIGAVDAKQRAAEIKGARPQRIVGAARHVGRQYDPLGALALDHAGRRRPAGPLRLAADALPPAPGKALPTDPDAVLDLPCRPPARSTAALIGLDEDGAGGQGRVKSTICLPE